jgi:hypothetical protein
MQRHVDRSAASGPKEINNKQKSQRSICDITIYMNMTLDRDPQVAWPYQAPACFQQWGSVNPRIKSWKIHLTEWGGLQTAAGSIFFSQRREELGLYHLVHEENYKPLFESGIFKSISWLNGSIFWGCDDDWGFLKNIVITYQMSPMSPLNSATFLLSSHL